MRLSPNVIICKPQPKQACKVSFYSKYVETLNVNKNPLISINDENLSIAKINTTDIPIDLFVLCERTIAIQPAEPVTLTHTLPAIGQ